MGHGSVCGALYKQNLPSCYPFRVWPCCVNGRRHVPKHLSRPCRPCPLLTSAKLLWFQHLPVRALGREEVVERKFQDLKTARTRGSNHENHPCDRMCLGQRCVWAGASFGFGQAEAFTQPPNKWSVSIRLDGESGKR